MVRNINNLSIELFNILLDRYNTPPNIKKVNNIEKFKIFKKDKLVPVR